MHSQPILVMGATGQVARALARLGSVGDHPVVCRGRPEADITDALALRELICALAPAAIVNAAAYTAVDKAETDAVAAFAANAEGPEHLARLCRDRDIPLVHLSTDYVFSGTNTTPYRETEAIAPLGVYGASKAAGEAAIRQTWPRHLILRTAWVYSLDGHNFLNTMLRLAAERDELSVVDDQLGTPTWAQDIASAIARLLPVLTTRGGTDTWGTYHLTNAGTTTWFGFATEIFGLAAGKGLRVPRLKAITTAEYPTPARRPAYSVLDNGKIAAAFGIRLPDWRSSLAACLEGLERS